MTSKIEYPISQRGNDVVALHNREIPDPYRWLENLDAAEIRSWIEAQNRLTEEHLSLSEHREPIRERLTELWSYEKYGVPVKKGGRTFFTVSDGLQNQPVLYWIERGESEPRVLLDPNTLSEDGTIALIQHALSEDGSLLAYGLSVSGSDWQEWRFRKVDGGQDLDDRLEWVKFSGAAFTKDGQGFFYSRYDEPEKGEAYKGANYFHKLFYHRLRTPQSQDELVYERRDQKEWGFHGAVSDDGRYLVVQVWRGTERENGRIYKDLEAGGPMVELLLDFDASYHYIGNDGPLFYFYTDLNAPRLRVIAIDVNQPVRADWKEIIPESDDAIQWVSLVGNRFVAVYLHDARHQVKVFNKAGQFLHEVELPGIGTVSGFEGTRKDDETYYLYTSFNTPGTVYRYDARENTSTLFGQPGLHFRPEDFETRQVFYFSKDGTRIPMFLSYKKGQQIDENTPAFLYGYGGFDIPMTPLFSTNALAWMEMGGIYAQASLRGGGEYGKEWHDAGRVLNKQNVFDDFIAAAEWLIENRYTSASKLAIGGRSNGGLLTGACLTQRPDLYGAVLVIVGVLDMLRFHTFTIGWGWVSDYGSPENLEEFEALLAYSPYHNIRAGTEYPPTLVMTGDHDDRVFPAHSFKFAAALQQAQACENPVLIRVETKARHGLGKPTSKLIAESVDMLAFMANHLGLEPDWPR
jgi:prolyl oligopeptidase